jgi:hypothetical protein
MVFSEAKQGVSKMDEKSFKEMAELRKQNEALRQLLIEKEKRIQALLGYLQNQHVNPDYLPV